jgi:hypothetical protein
MLFVTLSLEQALMSASGRKNGNVENNCGEIMEIAVKGFKLRFFCI